VRCGAISENGRYESLRCRYPLPDLVSSEQPTTFTPRSFALFTSDAGEASIVVPTIVLVEMTYLAEKKRIASELVKAALNLLREPSENYGLASLNLAVVEALEQVSRSLVPDMPDRILAAAALSLGATSEL
jgi:predicted nucleic acid-binding protein